MNIWWITIFLFAVVESNAEKDDDHGEYGSFNLWRKTMCEKGDDVIYSDVDKCRELQTKSIRDALNGCMKKTSPSTDGKYSLFLKEACNDLSIFFKVDECLEQQKSLYEEEGIGEEALACFEEMLKKYELRELLTYYIETESAKK